MCYFPMIIVAHHQVSELNRRLSVYQLRAVTDLGWLKAIAPDSLAFWVTNGHCGCGLYRRATQADRTDEALAVQQWLGIDRAGLSQALLDELQGVGNFGLWIQWGNRLPPLLRARHLEPIDFDSLRQSAPQLLENVFYQVETNWPCQVKG
jgi:hypothetical protein